MDKWQQFTAKQKVLAVPDQHFVQMLSVYVESIMVHLHSEVPTFMGTGILKTLWFPPGLLIPHIFLLCHF